MVAAKVMKAGAAPRLTVEYDRAVDVLHVLVGPAVPFEGTGLPGGIELDYSIESGEPIAAAVIGYERNDWSRKVGELAKLLGHHLRLEPGRLSRTIKQRVEEAI